MGAIYLTMTTADVREATRMWSFKLLVVIVFHFLAV